MLEKYLAEFRTNVRLRLLFAGVVAIVWFYAVLNLRDLAITKNEQFIGIERQIAKTKLQTSTADWPQRLQAIKLLQVELEGRLWQNSTQGLAQAAFQDWLNQAAIRATLGRPAVTMLAVEEKGDAGNNDNTANPASPNLQLWKVRAKLEFDFTPPGLMNLLKQITVNPQQVVVESLNIRKEPVPRVDMLLVANFQKQRRNSIGMLETIANRLGLSLGLILLLLAVVLWFMVPDPVAPRFLTSGSDTWSLPKLPKREPDPLIKTVADANMWGVVVVAATVAAPPLNSPEWRFVGIFNDGKEQHVMISIDKKPAVSLKVGEDLPGGAKILKIGDDTICVMINGQKRALGIYRT